MDRSYHGVCQNNNLLHTSEWQTEGLDSPFKGS